MYNYRFTEEKDPAEKIPVPKRISILIDAYLDAGKKVDKSIRMHYSPETIDNLESIFEQRVRARPDTLKILITAIYRVKHDNKEYYFYNITRTCKDALNHANRFSYDGYGHHRTPVITMRWKEGIEKSEPTVTGYEHGFELPWNKSEVKKLLDSSVVICEYFYVGNSGFLASEPVASPYYQIQSSKDWLEGSFEDLMDLGRLGLSYKEPSLYLVDPARKQEKQNIEKNVGLRDKQGLYA